MAYERKNKYIIYRVGEWFYDYDITYITKAQTKEEAIERIEKKREKEPKATFAIVHYTKEEQFVAEQKQKQKEWREEQRAKSKAERKAMRFSKDVENAYYKTSYKAGHLI